MKNSMHRRRMRIVKMVPEEDTSYDEVIRDIQDIGKWYIKNREARELFMKKIRQLCLMLGC